MVDDIAKELRGLRSKLGISQAELARRLKVNASTVARWEAGTSRPRMDMKTIASTAAGLGVAGVASIVAAAGPLGLGLLVASVIRNASQMGMSSEAISRLFDRQAGEQPDDEKKSA